jgi:hypothetical protein
MEGAALIAGTGGRFLVLFSQQGRDDARQADRQKNDGDLGTSHRHEDSGPGKDDSPLIINPNSRKSFWLGRLPKMLYGWP